MLQKKFEKFFLAENFLKIWLRFEKFSLKKQPKINPVFLGWVKFSNSGFGWVWGFKISC
jgi:hypothetical protein